MRFSLSPCASAVRALSPAAVLADNGRLSQLPKIASTYAEILMAHRGQVQATVTAALVRKLLGYVSFLLFALLGPLALDPLVVLDSAEPGGFP